MLSTQKHSNQQNLNGSYKLSLVLFNESKYKQITIIQPKTTKNGVNFEFKYNSIAVHFFLFAGIFLMTLNMQGICKVKTLQK